MKENYCEKLLKQKLCILETRPLFNVLMVGHGYGSILLILCRTSDSTETRPKIQPSAYKRSHIAEELFEEKLQYRS